MIVCKFNNEIKSGETDQLSGVTLQRDSYRNENPGVVLPQPHHRERARQTRGYCVVVFFWSVSFCFRTSYKFYHFGNPRLLDQITPSSGTLCD